MDQYSYIANADSGYIEELYQIYKRDPESVDPSWAKFFEGFDFSQAKYGSNGSDLDPDQISEIAYKEVKARYLIQAYRSRGHLISTTNPIRPRRDRKAVLDTEDFGLTDSDRDEEFDVGKAIGIGRAKLRDIESALRKVYAGNIGFEYSYIREPDILRWFKRKSEKEAMAFSPSIEEKKRILLKLNEAVVFENFLHTKYLGQKRFSLEGGETTIPALDSIITTSADLGVKECVIGMAHRGRLNILANIMGKTYEQVFSEFEGTAKADLTMGDGDVKYHMGYSSEIVTPHGKKVNVKLTPNPSHLEAVNPLVEGFVRAKLDALYSGDSDKILPILIHGDSAFAGQGINYEVIQMSQLPGYHTGGTIHFIINNQVGFTTDFDEARSSIYCTDVAKIIDAPVLHVNGDDPESVYFCVKLACEYRQKYKKDIFIDMVCYRRHGHNESDEPKFTQPLLYNLISKHLNPREVYNQSLIDRGDVDAKLADSMDKDFRDLLQARLNKVKQKPLPYEHQPLEKEWKALHRSSPKDFDKSPNTAISAAKIKKIANALVALPQDFKPIKQVEKLIAAREDMFFKSKELNWGSAELLAYGSLLIEGKIVRFSGQDVKRGTFSHRHALLRDAETNRPYLNLNHIDKKQQVFQIFNSLLSEYGVLGFEYGYAMANPGALVMWEAQFGDFANGAQVFVDQFITPSESKWQRMNGIVILLPHGYEGQGPEHSNARPERYLQLAAEYNMVIVNLTNPANIFHALRRQLAWPFRKPLIVFSPKSLLRHPKVMSPLSEFTRGGFKEMYPDKFVTAGKVFKVLLCTGKVYFDLLEEQQSKKIKDIAIIRIEQLHPFPKKQLDTELKKYKDPKLVWVQEEPVNMGPWTYLTRTLYNLPLDLVSRKPSASPATGYAKVHQEEQDKIVKAAFKR